MQQKFKKRLLKLADFLYNEVPPENFDLKSYFNDQNVLSQDAVKRLINRHCGTTACALGWSVVAFPKVIELVNGVPSFINDENDTPVYESFFGIKDVQDEDHFSYLFCDFSYPPGRRTPKYVANRIRAYVARDGKLPRGRYC